MLVKILIGSVVVLIAMSTSSNSIAETLFDSLEKALMPGKLTRAHAKYENDCSHCHKLLSRVNQNELCIACHDHKNIADDIKLKKGYHGLAPEITKGKCIVCHTEHKGRGTDIVLLDKQTFNHNDTDFPIKDSHTNVQCSMCHKKDKKYYEAPGKCIDCHKKQDIHKGKLGEECNNCHRESSWNDFLFDHDQTEFSLLGKHKGVECQNCHPQERFVSTPTDCYACHKGDDQHKGKFGKKCKACHVAKGWSNSKFNHDKDTKFRLVGQHKRVVCEQCHKKNPYKEKLAMGCFTCHEKNDEHKGQYGKKCQNCHTPKGWRKQKFDHDKTEFKLRGKHKKILCKDCHPGDLYKDKVKGSCYECHRQQDVHKGQQGKDCNNCHSAVGWLANIFFDHDQVSFPLLGTHSTITCEECHTSSKFKDIVKQCYSCHKAKDVHKLRLTRKCQKCHNPHDWKIWNFDHNKQTDFSLRGAHDGLNCYMCHKKPVKNNISLSNNCDRCHMDVHDGSYGRLCQRCHNETSFKETIFKN